MIEIIIPSKNELENLKIILTELRKLYSYNILVIDKSDNFYNVKKYCDNFKKIRCILQKSNGKGNALREAVNVANGDIVVFFDADCSHDPKDIKKLINPLLKNKNIDHVGGSRMRGGSDELYEDINHFLRLCGSLIINYSINFKFKTKLTDSQNGLRAIRKKVFNSLNSVSSHTSIEMEIVSKTLALGYNYIKQPTHEWKRLRGNSKINLWKHSWSYIYHLFKIILMKKHKQKKKISYEYEYWFKE